MSDKFKAIQEMLTPDVIAAIMVSDNRQFVHEASMLVCDRIRRLAYLEGLSGSESGTPEAWTEALTEAQETQAARSIETILEKYQ